MYRACVLLALLVAVTSATVKRSAPGDHGAHGAHGAHGDHEAQASYVAPVQYDYSLQDTDYSPYPAIHDQFGQPKEENFIERVFDSVTSFVDPLLKLDVVVLGLVLGGFILLLNFFSIINITPILDGLQSIFPTIVIDKGSARNMSPYATAARMLLGDDMERVSEIVHNAIDNVEKWKEF